MTDWTDAQVARLRELWTAGHSTAEIGRRMGMSKNAVISKSHRLGLPGRPSPIKRGGYTPPARAKLVRNKPTLPALASTMTRLEAGGRGTRPVPPRLVAPAAASQPIPIVSRPCCWPMWPHNVRPTHEYCGKRGVPGKPYCEPHMEKATARGSEIPPSLHRAVREGLRAA